MKWTQIHRHDFPPYVKETFNNYLRMKRLPVFVLFICLSFNIFGQTTDIVIKGTISYITTQNVYVKFENTEGLHIGDTLFISRNNILLPALTVNNLSTISCVGTPVGQVSLLVSTPIFGKIKVEKKPDKAHLPLSLR